MDGYEIITDPVELLSGTLNRMSPLYTEAATVVENNSAKSMGYLKNFITSIENMSYKVGGKDHQISDSKGNIQKFQGYKNIRVGLQFLSRNLGNEQIVKSLNEILRGLESNQQSYIDSYTKQVHLVMLEYETSTYLLVTGVSFALANYTDIQQSGTQVRVIKKPARDKGIITKLIQELGRELNTKDHKKYLTQIINTKDNVPISKKMESVTFTEASIIDTIELVKALWNGLDKTFTFGKNIVKTIYRSVFGILPLIRSILYLRYKRKADTIISLEEQIQFIEMNIDQLKNIKTMDKTKKDEIIKKQQAVIEAYRKKSEKLRAELIETEKDTAVALKEDEPEITKDSSDDFIID